MRTAVSRPDRAAAASRSAAGATRRASRTITNPIPQSSRIAAPAATRISVWELDELDSVFELVLVVRVVVVGVSALGVASSPNALLPLRLAAVAAAGSADSAI